MNPHFSFIILTYNEEQHLPRLLKSIADLQAETFILDSGSTDQTISIAQDFRVSLKQHSFENHPRQWDFALKNFPVKTAWVICLDADQIVTPELFQQLQHFNDKNFSDTNGIYFNRKNIFQGHWLRFGGYYPFYQLKMFRFKLGFSDLNENMDHRFVVPGKTMIWKKGHIIEENLKENNIRFWIDKHKHYSTLIAHEEFERMKEVRSQTIKPAFFGKPDERTAWLKRLWWKMPLHIRPFFYLFYRMVFRLGFLDGKTGIRFHYLHSFWFRNLVDGKINELRKKKEIK